MIAVQVKRAAMPYTLLFACTDEMVQPRGRPLEQKHA